MSYRLTIVSLFLFAALLGTLWQPLAPLPVQAEGEDQELSRPLVTGNKSGHPKLDTALYQMATSQQSVSAFASTTEGKPGSDVDLIDGYVRVIIVGLPENAARIAAAAGLHGAMVEASYDGLVQAMVPISSLSALAETPEISFMRQPFDVLEFATGEGVSLINAPAWQTAGYNGAGVKVGIIDSGFKDYTTLQGNGELPATINTKWAASVGNEGTSVHGTACAEIIYDIAPGATMYLANIGTDVEMGQAIDWFIAQGVDVISSSVGKFLGGPGDGTGFWNDQVNKAYGAGIVWAQAMGNHAQRHWSGAWSDGNGNNRHNWASNDETNNISVSAGDTITLYLKWDDVWGSSGNDYELLLFDSALSTPVATSQLEQNGNDDPWEAISYTALYTGVYHVAIGKYSGSSTTLRLYSFAHNYQYQTADGSFVQPADASGAMPVGAINYATPTTIESFSSRGPTKDGRTIPSISAPDGVTSVAYGDAFYGTSAATPHAAGAAVLVKDRYPSYTPAQVQSFLEGRAVDLGSVGKDNIFGAGRLYLGNASIYNLTANSTGGGNVTAPGEGVFNYAQNAVVNLTATPAANYTFRNWTGDNATIASTVAANTTITMSADYSITANFANNAPVLSSGNVTPTSGQYATTFTYSVNYTDAENAAPQSPYVAIDGGSNIKMTALDAGDTDYTNGRIYTYATVNLSKGTSHTYRFAASDGTSPATGDVAAHNGPTVLNTAPTAPTVNVTPTTLYTTSDLLSTITVPGVDVDGDNITYAYAWYKNNLLEAGLTSNTTPAASTTKGEVWRAEVTPNDGTANGTAGVSGNVTVLNTAPTISGVTITPDPAWSGSDLTATPYGWFDADGDALGYTYRWTIYPDNTKVTPPVAPANFAVVIGSVNITAGYLYELMVWPNDGTEAGISKGAEIIIQMSPTVNITAPANNFTTNAATVNVSGSANATPAVSEVTLEVNHNPRTIPVTDDAFNTEVTLLPGTNFIEVILTNMAGRASDNITVTRQDVPLLTLDNPLSGAVFGATPVTVSGTVDASPAVAQVSVSVNGSVANLSVTDGAYSGNVTLSANGNTVNVSATNAAGTGTSATISVTLDTQAPQVAITAPASGSATRLSSVNVSGTASDTPRLASVVFAVNGVRQTVALDTSDNISFNAAVNLIEGSNTIEVVATDNASTTSSAMVTVTRDTTAPAVTLTSPPYYFVTSQAAVTVEGQVSDSAVSQVTLNVNGLGQTPVAVSGGAFSQSVALSAGSNRITANATDAAGNSGSSATLVVVQDSTRPTVLIKQPRSGYVTSSASLRVTGNVTSGNNISSASLELNGSASTLNITGGQFSRRVTLVPGANIIEVFANDNATPANTGTSGVVTVTLDQQGPGVFLNYPMEGMLLGSVNVTLEGSVDDAAVTQAIVVLNGTNSTVSVRNGTFSVARTLQSGTNTILVTARDSYGNRGVSGTVTVEVQAGKPTVSVNTPNPDSVTGNATLPVSGTVTHTAQMTTATLYLNGNTSSVNLSAATPQAFGSTVTLVEGENTIVVSASDNATPANTGSSGVIYVTLDTTAPAVTLTSPMNGTTTSQASVNVSGSVDDPGVRQAALTLNGLATSIPVQAQRFNHSLALANGDNNISVTVTDSAGNTGNSGNLTVRRDASAPLVRITTPTNGASTNLTSANVSGTAVDTPALTQATLTLNGVAQTITVSDSAFNQAVTLASGSNVISVSANDGANTGNSGNISLTRDSTAPGLTIALSDPADSVKITVTADEALTGAPGVTVNGSAALSMTPVATNKWSGSYNITAPGAYTVNVSGTDRAGNNRISTATFAKRTLSLAANVSQQVTTADTTINITSNSTLAGQTLSVARHVENPASNSDSGLDAGLFVKIVASPNLRDNLSSIYMRVDYVDADITARGIDEATLKLYLWDVSTGQWEEVAGSSVDTVNNFICGTVDHLSEYGSFGSAPPPPPPPPPPPTSSGGGGGGGGGGSSKAKPPPPGSVVLAGLIKANGEFSKDVVAYSDDAAGILEIPMKTRAFDGLGAVITFLSLLKTETINLTAPATGNILAAYDLGPAATVFLPVVKFSITYPAGYTPGSGDYMAWWNGTDWVPLPSAVNTANGTMTALVSHFSRFALISLGQGQAAASATEFKVSELTLSPGSAAPHQVVLASVLVTNTQAQAGSGTVVLKLNGTTLATIDLTLAGDTSRRLIFSLAGPEPGTYEVAVNDASAVFKVSAP